jgi:putative ABC transport system permease protein
MSKVTARRTTLRPRDAIGEAATTIVARPLAATVTSFGVLLAVAWFVAVLGLVSTANGQVTSAFAGRQPTTLRITAPVSWLPGPASPYPAGAERRLDRLPGVVAAGIWWQVRLSRPVVVSAAPQVTSKGTGSTGTGLRRLDSPVIAATPGFLGAARVQVSQGAAFGTWDQAHAAQVCLVGSALARSLRITGFARQPTIYINDMACAVIGIIARAAAQQSVSRSVVLPSATAIVLFGPPDQRAGARPEVLVQTRPGAAEQVSREAPFAISTASPGRYSVRMQAGPVLLSRQVTGTLHRLFVVVGWVGLAVGILGIAAMTSFCVAQRIPEYALRRALGARRRHIAAHVLSESAILGLLGGLAGASLGIAVIVLVARASHWTPVVAPLTLWPAPLVGAGAGIIAGIGPAIRAAWIRPSNGLSRFPPP